MALLEFGFGACLLALLCVIVSSLAMFASFAWHRRCLPLTYTGCVYLFNQLHCNVFLASSLDDPYALLGRLERANRPEQDARSWYGLSWLFDHRARNYSRRMAIANTLHRRKSSDHGVVESVVRNASIGNVEPAGKGPFGRMKGKKGSHKCKY